LLLTNQYTIYAIDIGATIYLAGQLTRKQGYSMAACGYMHQGPTGRLPFTNQLSLNSPCRTFLQRISFIWLVMEATKLMSPIGATGKQTLYVSIPLTRKRKVCYFSISINLLDGSFVCFFLVNMTCRCKIYNNSRNRRRGPLHPVQPFKTPRSQLSYC
jgi:hypothetical protein